MSARRYGIDVLVVGAGIVGAAIAYEAARAGLRVCVLDRGGVAGGTTGAGEGNLLVSDKTPGPELDLALAATARWRELADGLGPAFEYEPKGGLVVAADGAAHHALTRLAAAQRAAGVEIEPVADPADVEPLLRRGLAGGVRYPGDAQVMPARAAAVLLAHDGVDFHPGVRVDELITSHNGRVIGVVTSAGHYSCGTVVNAAGPHAGELAASWGAPIPVEPRRGFVLVTAPRPRAIRHKVYTSAYLGDVSAADGDLRASPVVESTPAGPILIGATRERRGFDDTLSVRAVKALAAGAVDLFPPLADLPVTRCYAGFRPYVPDGLPVIGPDPRLSGLFHATGHEGAGVGLAPATAQLIVAAITDTPPPVDATPFAPTRFREVPT